ncbi:unnamed protein product [Gordionus sp. m RMFG-2023]
MVEGAVIVLEFATESTYYLSWLLNNNERYHSSFSSIKNIFLNGENDNKFIPNISNAMIQADKIISLSIDATLTLLYSIDDLIKDKCYDMNKIKMKICIIDNDLQYYIQNLPFYGLTGKIEFGLEQSLNNPLRIGNFPKVKGRYKIITVGNNDYSKENGSQLKLLANFTWKNYTYYNYLTAPTSSVQHHVE